MRKDQKTLNAEELAELTLRFVNGCHEKEKRLAKESGLTSAEFRALRFFAIHDIRNNKDVSTLMVISQSRSTRILDGLCDKGYIEREIDVSDRRNMVLSLTAKGRRKVTEINQEYLMTHKNILQNFTLKESQHIIQGVNRLVDALEEWLWEV